MNISETCIRRPVMTTLIMAALIVFAGWFAIEAAVLSLSKGIVHPYYVSALGPGTAALVGAGAVEMVRLRRQAPWWWSIAALAAEQGTQLPAAPDAVALAGFLARRRRDDPEHFADLSLAIVKLIGAAEYVVIAKGKETEGHFGLAVHDYTHATAPNRRYPDPVSYTHLRAHET